MVGGQKKHVFGSEGTVAGMGWQTYALRVGVLICSIYQSYQIYIMFHKSEACVQRTGVATVRVLEQDAFEVHDVSFTCHLILKIHLPLLWLTPC